MKAIIVISLYLIGIFVYAVWSFSNEEEIKKLEKEIDKNPDLAIFPDNILKILICIIVIFLSIAWPIDIILMPFTAIKNLLK